MFTLHTAPAVSVFCNKKKKTKTEEDCCISTLQLYLFVFWTVVKREEIEP